MYIILLFRFKVVFRFWSIETQHNRKGDSIELGLRWFVCIENQLSLEEIKRKEFLNDFSLAVNKCQTKEFSHVILYTTVRLPCSTRHANSSSLFFFFSLIRYSFGTELKGDLQTLCVFFWTITKRCRLMFMKWVKTLI